MSLNRARSAAVPGKESVAPLPGKVMSIDVITEAKRWTARSSAKTRRPNTPKDFKMKLFSDRTVSNSRPPSAFSLSSSNFDPDDIGSRPNSGYIPPVKLAPLPSIPIMPQNSDPVMTKPSLSTPRKNPSTYVADSSTSKKMLPMKAFSSGHERLFANDVDETSEGVKSSSGRHFVTPMQKGKVKSSFPSAGNSESTEFATLMKRHSASPSTKCASKLDVGGDPHEIRQNSADSFFCQRPHDDAMLGKSQKQAVGEPGTVHEESNDQAQYWNQNILPLLEKLESNQSEDDTFKTCLELDRALTTGDCIGSLTVRRRTSLLSTLFKQLNGSSYEVHLACAKIILDIRVRRQNLNTVCKMLFKISREKSSDELFIKVNLIKGMLELMSQCVDPLDNYESFVYLTGAIKFLCNNKVVADELAAQGCVLSFMSLLCSTMASLEKRKYVKKEKLHATDIAIQITAVLRVMTDLDRPAFVGSGFFDILFQVVDILRTDDVLVLNVSRLLSKLTMYNDLHAEFLSCRNWSAVVLNAINAYKNNIDIVVRLCFALGNVTAKNEEARVALYRTTTSKVKDGAPISCLEIFSDLIDARMKELVQDTTDQIGRENRVRETLDLMNKIIRVIANISISEQLGGEIASNQSCVSSILQLLEKVQVIDSEELIINTLTTLNNLSYYTLDKSVVLQKRMKIAALLLNIIIADNLPCVMEATRVFGNITQYIDVQELLHDSRVDSMMVALLDSDKWQMVYSACGVLINMTTTDHHRQCLVDEQVVSKLIDILKDFAPIEWRVGSVACQLLWNLCECPDSLDLMLTPEDSAVLTELLHMYLMEEAPFQLLDANALDNDMKEYILDVWQTEFQPVAKRLLKKICAYHSQLVPLDQQEVGDD